MTGKKVWVGYYYNHYNALVVFHTKPVKNKEGIYDTHDNRKCIAGTLFLEDFIELFPMADISSIVDKNTGNVIDTETKELLSFKMVAAWDGKRLKEFNFTFDGY